MKQVWVTIKLRQDNLDEPSEIEVKGYEFLPGLFIHRTLESGTTHQTKSNHWDITHKSGFNLCCFTDEPRTRKSILEPAIELLGGFDWTWNVPPVNSRKYAEAAKGLQMVVQKSLLRLH